MPLDIYIYIYTYVCTYVYMHSYTGILYMLDIYICVFIEYVYQGIDNTGKHAPSL